MKSNTTTRNNNFDLVRLWLASLVYLGHYNWIFPLGPTITHVLARLIGADGQKCVQGFFVISGYLVFQSYHRSNNLTIYFEKRIRRIYPGYVTVIFSSVVLGAFLTDLPIDNYISVALGKYLAANLTFLNFLKPTLPGVFTGQPVNYVNGPLWTLKVEVTFYILLPMIFWATKFLRFSVICLALYVVSSGYYAFFSHLGQSTGVHIYYVLSSQFPGQLRYFILGAFVASCQEQLVKYWQFCALLLVISLVAMFVWPLNLLLSPALLAVLVLSVCLLFPKIGQLEKYGDLSYGLYIIHFPLLQTIYATNLLNGHPMLRFMVATIGVFSLSYVMWHLIEGPALRGRWAKGQQAPQVKAVSG